MYLRQHYRSSSFYRVYVYQAQYSSIVSTAGDQQRHASRAHCTCDVCSLPPPGRRVGGAGGTAGYDVTASSTDAYQPASRAPARTYGRLPCVQVGISFKIWAASYIALADASSSNDTTAFTRSWQRLRGVHLALNSMYHGYPAAG